MQRATILGSGGSGKTTIGRRLADRIGVPIIHLDALFYDDQWNTMDAAEFTAAQEELVAADRWVIDGLRRHPADTAPSRRHCHSASPRPNSPAGLA